MNIIREGSYWAQIRLARRGREDVIKMRSWTIRIVSTNPAPNLSERRAELRVIEIGREVFYIR